MRLCHEIAAEQVRWWRANGISIADAVESMGQVVRPKRRIGRTWREVEEIVAREWWDAISLSHMQEAA